MLVGLLHEQARTIQNLTSSFAEVRREVRTTVTEIRSISQETPALHRLQHPSLTHLQSQANGYGRS